MNFNPPCNCIEYREQIKNLKAEASRLNSVITDMEIQARADETKADEELARLTSIITSQEHQIDLANQRFHDHAQKLTVEKAEVSRLKGIIGQIPTTPSIIDLLKKNNLWDVEASDSAPDMLFDLHVDNLVRRLNVSEARGLIEDLTLFILNAIGVPVPMSKKPAAAPAFFQCPYCPLQPVDAASYREHLKVHEPAAAPQQSMFDDSAPHGESKPHEPTMEVIKHINYRRGLAGKKPAAAPQQKADPVEFTDGESEYYDDGLASKKPAAVQKGEEKND